MQLLFHLRIEDLVLKVVAGPFEAGKAEERAVRDVLWGRGNNVVLDVSTTPKQPHQVTEVTWGHSLI